MPNKTKHTLTPKLRFPEFRDKPGWEGKELREIVTSISNGISLTQGNATSGVKVTRIETISESRIDLSKVGYVETDEDISAHKLAVGDILLSNINSVAHIGKSVIIDRDYDLYHGMNLLRLVVDSRLASPRFAFLALNTDEARASIRARANKAVNQASINQTELGRTLVVVPQLAEQQKIADCLSSLDALIAAEGCKLEALRAHKQGLMQHLFPRPGETRPRLRFPEFRKAPEWEEKALGDFCEVLNNRRVPISSNERTPGPYPYYGASGVVDFVDDYIFDERLVLLGEDGAKWKAFEETAFIAEGKYWVNNHAHVLKPVGVIDTLLANYLTMVDIGGFVTGNAPPKLTLAKLKTIPVPISRSIEEQQSIADCFSSLDGGIAAQSQKLAALQAHKKGLMQQLFPSPEEAQA